MGSPQRRLFLIVLILTASGSVRADNPSLPWAFNAPRADGYAIDLVDVKPAPGTPLAAGHFVDFLVTVRYSLTIANHGTIILVFEDENDHSATPKGPQLMQKVDGPGGEVTLREGITVPTHAKELRLFVPLVPDGITHTTGEATIRYPIT
jgi:hypothetical protein